MTDDHDGNRLEWWDISEEDGPGKDGEPLPPYWRATIDTWTLDVWKDEGGCSWDVTELESGASLSGGGEPTLADAMNEAEATWREMRRVQAKRIGSGAL